jgi:hypothetical protein
MFTPSNPIKATYKSYRYCLASNKEVAKLLINGNLATIDCQVVSANLAIFVRRTKSDVLAIKEAKLLAIKMMLSNAGDIMLMSSSQRQEDTCYIQYSAY